MSPVLHETHHDKLRFAENNAERYRSALYLSDEGFCVIEMIFDADGTAVDWTYLETNPAFAQQTGLADAQGQRVRVLIPDIEQYWLNTYGEVARTGAPIRFESFARGLNRWFSLYAFRIDHADRNRVAVIFNEITALKQAQQRADFLTALSQKLAAAATEAEIVRMAVEAVGAQLNADRCYFLECRENENLIVASFNWLRGSSRSVEGRYSLYDFGGIEWWRQYSRGNFAVEDVETHPLTRQKLANYATVGVRSYAVQPYRRDGEWTVILAVTETLPRQWTTHELSLMEDTAARVWPLVERARADRALRESEERFRLAMTAADMGSWRVDLKSGLSTRDAGFNRMLGRPAADSTQPLDECIGLIHPTDKPAALASWQNALATHGLYQAEFRIAHPDGTHHWLGERGRVIADFHGAPAFVTGVTLDITSRRQADADLRESKAFLQSVVGASVDCLKVLDLEGRLEWMSDNGQKLMEVCDMSSITGKSWPELWSDEAAKKEVVASLHAARQGRNTHFRGFCRTAAGTPKWWDVIVSPIIGSDGKPTQILSVSRDVTAMHEVEEALKNSQTALDQRSQALEVRVAELRTAQSEAETATRSVADSAERFRLLSEVVALQVWTANTHGELDYVNQECREYLGGDPERDILGNAWAQYVHAEDLPTALAAWQTSLASGVRYEVEFRLKGTDGEHRWFLVRAEAMRDRLGNIVRWFGTNTEIHELKTAQNAAERASRAKDDFLAALSHELRTPLTPVLMTAASLREDERLPADVREQLSMMERNIALEARLIDDLLDLTKISHGKLQLRAQPCDAHALIELAIEIVREDARAKQIVIERHFTAPRTELHADPARFQQVIWNLLRNAVKFTPHAGTISIHTHEEKNVAGTAWLNIEVRDSGIGIEPARIEQIFRPFDQGGLTGDHRFGGVGLGLAIARAVVDLHGGRISAHSAGLGRGATFTVALPKITRLPFSGGESTPPLPVPSTGDHAPSGQNGIRTADTFLRLLVVEDHENTLKTLRRLLEREGHAVTTASTSTDALATAGKQTFDLVISDLGLPDGSGTELMQKLRAAHGLSGIALSGYGMEEDIVRSREAGFIAHLVKPIQFAELRRTLAAFRERRVL